MIYTLKYHLAYSLENGITVGKSEGRNYETMSDCPKLLDRKYLKYVWQFIPKCLQNFVLSKLSVYSASCC